MEYNILKEKCIPIRWIQGGFEQISVTEVFERAHEIKGIFTKSPAEEYGLKRMLTALFMDMYMPEDNKELQKIYNKGKFDLGDRFNTYIAEVGEERFDLCHEKTPFYQSQKQNVESNRLIDYICPDIPSGASPSFYFREHKLDLSDCLRALCASTIFAAGGGGSGVRGCITGHNPPYYMWIVGETLFQEIIVNSVSVSDWDVYGAGVTMPYRGNGTKEGKDAAREVLWKQSLEDESTKYAPYATMSLLEGMTYVSKSIKLLDLGKSDYVENIWCDNLQTFINKKTATKTTEKVSTDNNAQLYDRWRDPHCIYSVNKKDIKAVIPAMRDNLLFWYSLIGGMYSKKGSLLTLRKFNMLGTSGSVKERQERALQKFGLKEINLLSYSTFYNQASCLWWSRNYFAVDMDLLEEEDNDIVLKEYFIQAVELVKKIGNIISKPVYMPTRKKASVSTESVSFEVNVYGSFYTVMQDYLTSYYLVGLKGLQGVTEEDRTTYLNDLEKALRDNLYKCALQCYDEILKQAEHRTILVGDVPEYKDLLNSAEVYQVISYNNIKKELRKVLKLEDCKQDNSIEKVSKTKNKKIKEIEDEK